jgi:hypothetical protein
VTYAPKSNENQRETRRAVATRGAEPLSSRFELNEQYLAAPDSAALKSALIRAHDRRRDEPVILKYWNKAGSPIDADLREMWRHEMRQLDRVRAYPGCRRGDASSSSPICSRTVTHTRFFQSRLQSEFLRPLPLLPNQGQPPRFLHLQRSPHLQGGLLLRNTRLRR